jgi:hypothetical protein
MSETGDRIMNNHAVQEAGDLGHEQTDTSVVLACDLTAIPEDQRANHQRNASYLFSHVAQEVQELPQGYAIRFAADAYTLVTAFVANERLCCPFFTFRVEVLPQQGPIWLRITGPEGVKPLLRAALNFAEG